MHVPIIIQGANSIGSADWRRNYRLRQIAVSYLLLVHDIDWEGVPCLHTLSVLPLAWGRSFDVDGTWIMDRDNTNLYKISLCVNSSCKTRKLASN